MGEAKEKDSFLHHTSALVTRLLVLLGISEKGDMIISCKPMDESWLTTMD